MDYEKNESLLSRCSFFLWDKKKITIGLSICNMFISKAPLLVEY